MVYVTVGRPSVRSSVPSIDSSNGGRGFAAERRRLQQRSVMLSLGLGLGLGLGLEPCGLVNNVIPANSSVNLYHYSC